MTPNLNKILKALAKELTLEVTREVTQKIRESYAEDVTPIIKDYLNNNQIFNSSSTGWLTLQDIASKYHLSIRAVGYKCKQFEVERKQVGRHNLVNEAQFLKAHDRPMEKPTFLKKKTAA